MLYEVVFVVFVFVFVFGHLLVLLARVVVVVYDISGGVVGRVWK